jgi:hypothetical protein
VSSGLEYVSIPFLVLEILSTHLKVPQLLPLMLVHPSSYSGLWTLADRKIATRLQEVRKLPRLQSEIGRLGRLKKLSDSICIRGRERGRMGSAWKKSVLKRAFVVAVAQRRKAWPGRDSLFAS